jgi:predicted small lipoprotein YifL
MRPITLLPVLVLLIALSVSGCGKKGPLYLPDAPASPSNPIKP